MPKKTYTQINSVTLAASSASVTFSGIPQNYRDLVLVFVGTSSSDENLTPTINGSSSDFSWVQMTSAPTSNSGTNNSIGRVAGSSQTFGTLQFMDYSATDKHKTFLVRTNVTGTEVRQLAARWAQTTAITSIGLAIRTGFTWNSGSTFTLYGIEA